MRRQAFYACPKRGVYQWTGIYAIPSMTQPQSVCGYMGLLTAEGAPEEDALAVIERLYAGLFYDALFDFTTMWAM